ncbi:hypothetical protein IMZ08_18225 [Bacillus luteolus]|uniref:Uncharacterized protein n=1 Tax=Litchfieldia luteola TaxID=682179 RepID=A0ABR9QN97_9BACI|nr:hypothetical protein [Cytobacillus luteolus]MBE4909977.1 hypothetical protein [Cytobacillus luteolus]MBP1942464.1 hypothetical protein [Cytobacillus luteolus]
MKRNILRVVWIIPNVFCYLITLGLTVLVYINFEGLQEINRLVVYIVFIILFSIVSVQGSFRILKWISEGKL